MSALSISATRAHSQPLTEYRRHKKRGGYALMEVLIALAIVGSMIGLYAYNTSEQNSKTRSIIAGEQMKTFANAMQQYITDNYSAVEGVATTTMPALIRPSTLVNMGYLPSGYEGINSYNQSVCGLVLKTPQGKLNALAVAEGGDKIGDVDLGQIVGTMGSEGGAVYSTNTGVIRGTMGGWSIPVGDYANANASGMKCNGDAGSVVLEEGHPMMAMWFSSGDQNSQMLHRNKVDGEPHLNTMQTDLNMGDNNIYNANTIQANSDISTDGWLRTKENKGWINDTHGGGWYMSDGSWVRSIDDKNVYTGGQVQAGTVRANSRMSVGEYLQVEGIAVLNTSCSPNGLVGRDNTGLLLSCQGGLWKKASGAGGFGGMYTYSRQVPSWGTGWCNRANPVTGSCSCPSGMTGHFLPLFAQRNDNDGGGGGMGHTPDTYEGYVFCYGT